jgi:CRP-like cAMP-binding protein
VAAAAAAGAAAAAAAVAAAEAPPAGPSAAAGSVPVAAIELVRVAAPAPEADEPAIEPDDELPGATIELVADEPDASEVRGGEDGPLQPLPWPPRPRAPTPPPVPVDAAPPPRRVSAPHVVATDEEPQVSPLVAALADAAMIGGRVLDGGLATEFAVGRNTGELALDDISLRDRLAIKDSGGHAEIPLDDEPKMDVVQAVAGAIGTSPLLSELDSDLVKSLIDAGTMLTRKLGEDIFKQGDAGSSLFLILTGEVAVLREGPAGGPQELARLRAGAFFGEMALITNQVRTATVRASRPTTLLEISRKSVRGLIDREPRILKLLMRFFRARLVGTLLQTSPVFEGFSREDKKKLVSSFRLRELGPGYSVFEETARAEGLFVLLAGRLEVVRGLDHVLGALAPGDVFGEMSLLDGSPAMATVRAKVRSWVLLLPSASFEDLTKRYPEIRGRLNALAETRRARNEAKAAHEKRVEPV